jgi:hypothetical protein
MLADVTEAIDINALVISAGEALLEKHGRKTKLPW